MLQGFSAQPTKTCPPQAHRQRSNSMQNDHTVGAPNSARVLCFAKWPPAPEPGSCGQKDLPGIPRAQDRKRTRPFDRS